MAVEGNRRSFSSHLFFFKLHLSMFQFFLLSAKPHKTCVCRQQKKKTIQKSLHEEVCPSSRFYALAICFAFQLRFLSSIKGRRNGKEGGGRRKPRGPEGSKQPFSQSGVGRRRAPDSFRRSWMSCRAGGSQAERKGGNQAERQAEVGGPFRKLQGGTQDNTYPSSIHRIASLPSTCASLSILSLVSAHPKLFHTLSFRFFFFVGHSPNREGHTQREKEHLGSPARVLPSLLTVAPLTTKKTVVSSSTNLCTPRESGSTQKKAAAEEREETRSNFEPIKMAFCFLLIPPAGGRHWRCQGGCGVRGASRGKNVEQNR
mmetsp:Transcript_8326/g.16194  ORF Transcript_8326/g.16194 Transcript_8326/m.16194 type:complete len:315 (-) Transcript_8326:112-1056(-)